jgi:hypothetical protein
MVFGAFVRMDDLARKFPAQVDEFAVVEAAPALDHEFGKIVEKLRPRFWRAKDQQLRQASGMVTVPSFSLWVTRKTGCRPKITDFVVMTATLGGSSKGQVMLSVLEACRRSYQSSTLCLSRPSDLRSLPPYYDLIRLFNEAPF